MTASRRYRFSFVRFINVPALPLLACLSFASCSLQGPHPIQKELSEVHVIHADGSGDRILAVGGPYYPILLADTTIILQNNLDDVYMATYTGSAIKQLSFGYHWGSCTMSPDRRKVMLSTIAAGFNDVYTMSTDGTNLSKLNFAAGEYVQPALSPNSDELVFRRSHLLCVMGINGDNLRIIDSLGPNLYPESALYLDENRVLYSVDSGSTTSASLNSGSTSIVVYDKRNGSHTLVVAHHQLCYFGQHVVRGDTLLCVEGSTMKLLNLRTTTVFTLGPAGWSSYSPDGTKVVSTDGAQRHIIIQDVQSGMSQMVYTESDPGKPIYALEISPDNKFIVFVAVYSVPE